MIASRALLLAGFSFLVAFLLLPEKGHAQDTTDYRRLFSIYEDNDLVKILGAPSDRGYTNGTRLDYFYTKKNSSRFFLDKWMPKAGGNAVNTFGWGLMQIMFTPSDLATTEPDIKDWPYTGALYLTYSLHSSNPKKKYNLQTGIIAGVMGKASLAEQLQTFIHKNTNSDKPMGWSRQYPTDVLLNLNVTIEKMLWQYRNWLEVIGGGLGMLGIMMDGASLYGQVRIGIMRPYFDGLIPQYNSRFGQKKAFQLYLIARPALEWIGYNAVLQGGVFSGKSDYYKQAGDEKVNASISRRFDLGVILGYGNVSFSFTQRVMPRLEEGLGHQRVGNISLYVAW